MHSIRFDDKRGDIVLDEGCSSLQALTCVPKTGPPRAPSAGFHMNRFLITIVRSWLLHKCQAKTRSGFILVSRMHGKSWPWKWKERPAHRTAYTDELLNMALLALIGLNAAEIHGWLVDGHHKQIVQGHIQQLMHVAQLFDGQVSCMWCHIVMSMFTMIVIRSFAWRRSITRIRKISRSFVHLKTREQHFFSSGLWRRFILDCPGGLETGYASTRDDVGRRQRHILRRSSSTTIRMVSDGRCSCRHLHGEGHREGIPASDLWRGVGKDLLTGDQRLFVFPCWLLHLHVRTQLAIQRLR